MNKKRLQDFLLKARTKTYAGDSGKVKSAFAGSYQLEFKEKDFLYRDIYYNGNGIFPGLETIYFKEKPAWSMSYYGNFKKMAEEEVDRVLRKALIENWQTARTWQNVEWRFEDYTYSCEPGPNGSIDEMTGTEKIFKNGKEIYFFYYAGGIVAK